MSPPQQFLQQKDFKARCSPQSAVTGEALLRGHYWPAAASLRPRGATAHSDILQKQAPCSQKALEGGDLQVNKPGHIRVMGVDGDGDDDDNDDDDVVYTQAQTGHTDECVPPTPVSRRPFPWLGTCLITK